MQSTTPAVGPIQATTPKHPHPLNVSSAITLLVFSPSNTIATPRSLSCIFSGCSHCTNLAEDIFPSVEECVEHHRTIHPELFSSLALPKYEDVCTKAKFLVCTKCYAYMTFSLDPWISHHNNCIGRDTLQRNLLYPQSSIALSQPSHPTFPFQAPSNNPSMHPRVQPFHSFQCELP